MPRPIESLVDEAFKMCQVEKQDVKRERENVVDVITKDQHRGGLDNTTADYSLENGTRNHQQGGARCE